MRLALLTLLLLWNFLSVGSPSVIAEEFDKASMPISLEFPKDYGAHPNFKTEWWYYTGHLFEEGKTMFQDSPSYGFQLTFFRQGGATPRSSSWETTYLAHGALTRLERGDFIKSSTFASGGLGVAGATERYQDVWLNQWRALQIGLTHILNFNLPDGEKRTELQLLAHSDGPPVLHGEKGFSKKGSCEHCASYYYSFPRLRVSGRIIENGVPRSLHGTAWMDHEFMTNTLEAGQTGWDWFSITTKQGQSIMLFRLRHKDKGKEVFSGTHVSGGTVTSLGNGDFTIEEVGTWKSPETGATYPQGWKINIPKFDFSTKLLPKIKNQEHTSEKGGPSYWEGAVMGDGDPGILGYVELVGYAGELDRTF